MLNQFLLMGRLGENPRETTTPNGNKVVSLLVACQKEFRNQDGTYDTDFFRVEIWKGLADLATKNLKKGMLVCIRSRLENNNYVNKEGKKVYETRIVGERLLYVEYANKSKTLDEEIEENLEEIE